MNNFPDFSPQGYEITRELGHNFTGGRVTYLATNLNTGQKVVIKQFQFAQLDSNWGEYQAHEQEIKLLQQLNHPGIPRYLDSFQTEAGFCMVQEYKQSQSLATPRNWKLLEVKHIAISVLEILVYLQSERPGIEQQEAEEMSAYLVQQNRKTPAIIHRDLKPENILIDEEHHVYLVDFGFARSGGGKIAASSVVKGSMGFMPPEQLFNRQLTLASDLYGLGATLICLLTGTKSTDIGSLVDSNYRFHFRHLIPPQERGWLNWLEKMVEPNFNDRYPSAAEALAALKPLDVHQLPKVRLSQNWLELTASQWGEKLTATIQVSNPIPNTILSGRWEVAPHPSDPPHTPYDHSWISFEPQKFAANYAECEITIDTSKLLPEQIYQRQIILQSNASENSAINLQVITASLQVNQIPNKFSLGVIFLLFLGAGLLLNLGFPQSLLIGFIVFTGLAAFDVILSKFELDQLRWLIIVASIVGTVLGAIAGSFFGSKFFLGFPLGFAIVLLLVITGAFLGAFSVKIFTDYPALINLKFKNFLQFGVILTLAVIKTIAQLVGINQKFIGLIVVILVIWAVLWFVIRFGVMDQMAKGFNQQDAAILVILTAGFGIGLGGWLAIIPRFDFPLGFRALNVFVIGCLPLAALYFISHLLYQKVIQQPRQIKKILAAYQQNKEQLIKP
ncbi:MAG: protein kinase [Gomphosphaeria aponina SAG 52.96 = DSM 107014]|uniref:non-specific serine/threonine protein kinase n=1 Tax=Gomphosphaeria aponina SAG 52.96 = DSM 107014 TaxID=1521640 RepID=A0A941JUB7_9CHRO|nr:protein kinase [Gomphosphaeria aponina SAG 52.96 = DSM 107014]